MKLADLMKGIVDKKVPNYLIFTGEEIAVMDIYIQRLLELGYKRVVCNSVSDALNMMHTKSFDHSNKLFIILNDDIYKKHEESWDKVKKEFDCSKHNLLLKYSKIEKTTKFYTRQKDSIIYFDKLSEDVILKYIEKDIGLTGRYADRLAESCDSNYNRILLEEDKIKHYMNVTGEDVQHTIELLFKENAIYENIGDITFCLTDSVLKGDIDGTADYLKKAKEKGEPAIMVFSILYKGFKNMLLVQGLGKDKTNAGKRTGLSGWEIRQVFNNMGAYKNSEILNNLRILEDAHYGITSGTLEEKDALDYVISKIIY